MPVVAQVARLFHTLQMVSIGGRGVLFDFRGVVIPPERLLTLVDLAAAAGLDTVILQWGDLFPWTFANSSLQDRASLSQSTSVPEAAIAAMERRAAESSVRLIPGIDIGSGLDDLFFASAFRRAAGYVRSASSFRSDVDTALHLAKSVVEDLCSLHSSSTHLFVGGFISAVAVSRSLYFERYVSPLLVHIIGRGIVPVVHEAVTVEVDAELLRSVTQRGACIVLVEKSEGADERAVDLAAIGFEPWFLAPGYEMHDGVPEPVSCSDVLNFGSPRVDRRGALTLLDCRVRASSYEPAIVLLEEYFPLFLRNSENPTARAEHATSERVQTVSSSLRAAVSESWTWAHRCRECLVMATVDGKRRSSEGYGPRRLLDLARLSAGTATLYAHELRELCRGRVDGASLEEMIAVQLRPIEEELCVIEARTRQILGH